MNIIIREFGLNNRDWLTTTSSVFDRFESGFTHALGAGFRFRHVHQRHAEMLAVVVAVVHAGRIRQTYSNTIAIEQLIQSTANVNELGNNSWIIYPITEIKC